MKVPTTDSIWGWVERREVRRTTRTAGGSLPGDDETHDTRISEAQTLVIENRPRLV